MESITERSGNSWKVSKYLEIKQQASGKKKKSKEITTETGLIAKQGSDQLATSAVGKEKNDVHMGQALSPYLQSRCPRPSSATVLQLPESSNPYQRPKCDLCITKVFDVYSGSDFPPEFRTCQQRTGPFIQSPETPQLQREKTRTLCPRRCIVQPSWTGSSSGFSSQQLLGSQSRTPTSLTPLSLHAAPHISSSLHWTFLNFSSCTMSTSLRDQSLQPRLPTGIDLVHASKAAFLTLHHNDCFLYSHRLHSRTHSLQRHRAQQP